MASPGNRHCANCIGTLSFAISTAQCAMLQQWRITLGGGVRCAGHGRRNPASPPTIF